MTDIADILDRAADLIEPEGAWIQGAMARDASGRAWVDHYSSLAVCFCGFAAICRATGRNDRGDRRLRAMGFLNQLLGGSFVLWNDAPERTQAEVVAKLREAANKARGQS